MPKDVRADLSLLKQMVVELEKQMEESYKIRESISGVQAEENYRTFVTELYKAVGILSGIAQESGLLVGDLQKLVQMTSPKPEKDPSTVLESIFSGMKSGRGGTRN